MLPFLKKKNEGQSSGLIIKTRAPDEKPENESEEDNSSEAIEACAQALINAIHARDPKGAAMALKDVFDVLESTPHEEAENSIEPHSYTAQNIKAGIKE